MACLEPAERNLEEKKPDHPKTALVSPPNSHMLRIRPILKSIYDERNNSRIITSGPSVPRKTVPSLDPNHPHIQLSSDDALLFKSHTLRHPWGIKRFFMDPFQLPVFKKVILDMANAISKRRKYRTCQTEICKPKWSRVMVRPTRLTSN